jgi:flavocytochrome c
MINKVIVIGGGLSGLSAAHTVIEHGGRVLLLDKNPFCGGNSTKATSGINAALTKTQIRKGVDDSVSQFERDTARSANLGKSDQSYPLAKTLANDSDPAVEWLTGTFGIDLSLVSRLGGHSQPRTHRGKERFPGMTITYALLERLEEIEKNSNGHLAKIITKAKVNKLISDEKGNVVGVEYEKDGKTFTENGIVIIATGGFGADFTPTSLLQKYRPDLGHLPTTNGNHCTGDGLKMATSVGGDLVDMEWVQVHPTGLVHPDDPNAKVKFLAAEALRGVGGILLNINGERFCDELGRRDYVTGEMNKNKGPYRLVLNGKAGKEIEWHCKHYIGRKLMKKFDSGKALADEMKIPQEKLAETFKQYNEDAKKGTDAYGKKFFTNVPFEMNDHFFVSFVTPVVHYCMGGIRISTEGEVLGNQNNVISGLFAAGEVTGGVHGKNRLGGNSLIECVVFGRIAGRSASRYLLQSSISKLALNKCSNNQTINRLCMIRNHLSASNEKEFSAEEVSKHNKDGDVWLILNGGVYDVSKFILDHPGGKDTIMEYAGKDATDTFDLIHQDTVLKRYGPAMRIGKLSKNNTTNNNNSSTVPPYLKLIPSNTPSRTSGGTADILPNERKNASFDIQELTHILNGGKDSTKRRKFLESVLSKDPEDLHQVYNYTRGESLKYHVKEFARIHKPYKDFKPTREDICIMAEISIGYGSLNNSHGIFVSTIYGQGNEEQQRYWAPKLLNFEITGSYAQTELGHGSNVRGLETTAVYDKETDEFVLNTPTLTSIKWWPGALGKASTHCVLYAQLLIDGKEYGVNVFVVQIRDENHLPLPGIRLGDLGNKVGDNANDTGFMSLENVRIPRTHMLSKYRTVNKEGKYVDVVKADPKVHYTTMMTTRANMVTTGAGRLCQAATIAIRYSCVRRQGFVDSNSNVSYKTQELKIVDHKIQQYRLFKQLAIGYALKFTSRWMIEQVMLLEGKSFGVINNTEILKEIAASSAGLKSLVTLISTSGAEDLRKCCGGNGYLLNSGIAALCCDYLWQVTAEGDTVILGLLTARHIVNSIGHALGGSKLTGIMEYFNILGDKNFSLASMRPKRVDNPSDFLNLNYLFSWFKYRSLERNYNIAMEYNNLLKKNVRKEEAWNLCTNDLLKASHSHCYYIIMQNFVNRINELTCPKIKNVLTRLCALFSLTNFLDENWGDSIEADQFRLIRVSVMNLLNEIRPDCIPLVDAFDYPDNVLKSTIGRYDGNVYESLYDAAQKSVLNRTDPFDGYNEYLRPHLNKELLKRGNKPILGSKL